jgi:spermidine/putrescine transport system permease protein
MKKTWGWFEFGIVTITFITGAIILAPTVAVVALSLFDRGRITFEWYFEAITGSGHESMMNSIWFAILIGILGTILGGIEALNWWNRTWRELLIGVSFAVAALPGSLYSIGLMQLLLILGVRHSSSVALVTAQVLLVMPFCATLMMAGLSHVQEGVVSAGLELTDGRSGVVALKVVLPLAWPSIVSSFVVGFLISINEFVRTSYLSGSERYLSKYIYGKMNSGADPSVYALGGINVLAAGLAVVAIAFSMSVVRKRTSN